MGGAVNLQAADVSWEFPAKDFSVALSTDGSRWSETFSTDSNLMQDTHVSLGSRSAAYLRVTMRAPHPTYGKFGGNSLYGIRSLRILASGMEAVVDDCDAASQCGRS